MNDVFTHLTFLPGASASEQRHWSSYSPEELAFYFKKAARWMAEATGPNALEPALCRHGTEEMIAELLYRMDCFCHDYEGVDYYHATWYLAARLAGNARETAEAALGVMANGKMEPTITKSEYARQALSIAEVLNDPDLIARSCCAYALMHLRDRRPLQALPYARRAVEMSETPGCEHAASIARTILERSEKACAALSET